MSSVEASERGDDSLSDQQEIILKNNKVHRNRHNSRASKNTKSENILYNEVFRQYMFGQFQVASENCKKMIASNPQNPEPYFLMATMYEEAAQKNKDQAQLYKSVEYFFFNAYYSSPSVEKWLKVADMSYRLQLYQQAAYCYGRALKMDKTNLEISLKRAECLQMCLQIKKATNIYKRIIQKISNSVEVYKKYAKLRFRREQFGKARQILQSYPFYKEDLNIKFMIAETYLKQKKYLQLFQFIVRNIIQPKKIHMSQIYQKLEIQFIQMLFICRVNCPNKTSTQFKIGEMLQFLKSQYDKEQSSLYQQIVEYIKKYNSEITYSLLSFLLKFQPHQLIQNYLYCSQYLVGSGHCQQAIKILESGLETDKNRGSVELKTQLNYLKILLKNKNKNVPKFAPNKNKTLYKEQQEIFYSDDSGFKNQQEEQNQNDLKNEQSYKQQEQQDQIQQKNSKKRHKQEAKKGKKIKKMNKNSKNNSQLKHIQIKDPQTVSKLVQNNYRTLEALHNEIQAQKNESKGRNLQKIMGRNYEGVKECLLYLIEIQSVRDEQSTETQFMKTNQSIFNNREPKKRRTILGSRYRRFNLISKNSTLLLQSLKHIIYFIKEYIILKKFQHVLEFVQLLSKAHFFKWQNRILQFKNTKKQLYEMGVLACLQLKKYGKSIFFLRYLIKKNPLDEFYLSIAQKIMRQSKGKLFINKLIKNGLDNVTKPNEQKNENNFVKVYYLAGIEYMQNCFFELALNMFAKVTKILQVNQSSQNPTQIEDPSTRQLCKITYLCMATCFLQMASCRTVFNKLDNVNRSVFCLAQYKNHADDPDESVYNEARWFSYIKMFSKAIPLYNKILQQSSNDQLVKRSAVNLMLIYKQLQEFDKINQISQKYFLQT